MESQKIDLQNLVAYWPNVLPNISQAETEDPTITTSADKSSKYETQVQCKKQKHICDVITHLLSTAS